MSAINAKIAYASCADPENFVRGGPALTTFFLVYEGREDPNTTISGPLSARQRNAIRWSAEDGPGPILKADW